MASSYSRNIGTPFLLATLRQIFAYAHTRSQIRQRRAAWRRARSRSLTKHLHTRLIYTTALRTSFVVINLCCAWCKCVAKRRVWFLCQVMSSSSFARPVMFLAAGMGQLRDSLGNNCSGEYLSAADVLLDGCTSIGSLDPFVAGLVGFEAFNSHVALSLLHTICIRVGSLEISDSGDVSLPSLRRISGKLFVKARRVGLTQNRVLCNVLVDVGWFA